MQPRALTLGCKQKEKMKISYLLIEISLNFIIKKKYEILHSSNDLLIININSIEIKFTALTYDFIIDSKNRIINIRSKTLELSYKPFLTKLIDESISEDNKYTIDLHDPNFVEIFENLLESIIESCISPPTKRKEE